MSNQTNNYGDFLISTLKNTGYSPESLKDKVVEVLEENKADDVIVVPLAGKSALADYMVIASGMSARHVAALSDFTEQAVGKTAPRCRIEGKQTGDWVLVDLGDVIVHLFRPEVRAFYNIEKIWIDGFEGLPLKTENEAENAIFQG